MYYVICPYCHLGIEVPAAEAGPECATLQNVGHCPDCGESFYFDAVEVFEETFGGRPPKDGRYPADHLRPASFALIPVPFPRGTDSLYFVVCPTCNTEVELPADSVGPDRTDLFNVVGCPECSRGFDYDDEDVMEKRLPPGP